MKFDPLKFDDDEAFERAAAFIHDTQADKQVPDSARELMDSGISELRSALADLGDRDIARVLLVIGTLHGQLIDRSPGWSRVVIANLTLHIAAQLWRENTPGAAALLKDIADAAADSAAFTALERLHARIHRDFNFDAGECAPPTEDEIALRMMDDLVRFADEVYLPLADADEVTTEPEKLTPEQWCERYGLDIIDPDGWRGRDDPPWSEPLTLPDFWARYGRSTARGVDGAVYARIVVDVRAARETESRS